MTTSKHTDSRTRTSTLLLIAAMCQLGRELTKIVPVRLLPWLAWCFGVRVESTEVGSFIERDVRLIYVGAYR